MNISENKLITQYDSEAIESRGGCVASAMQIIGNKWTALILKEIAAGPKRFGEIEKAVGDISPRTLSQRLDDLESHKIVSKVSYHEVPPRVEYSLTPKGQDLVPVLRSMAEWGNKYYDANC